MTSKLTIEQAKRLRNDFECWQQDYDPKDDKGQYDMFGRGMVAMDMLIAGMYQEPVAYTDERNLGYIDRGRETAYLWGKQNSEASDVALYRHAQLAPASPVCTCPSGDGSLRWPCPVHAGNSPAQSDCCPAQNHVSPEQNGDTPAQSQGWIQVSERMPENDGAYLCWDNRYVTTYAFIFGAWQANQFIAKNITHWMPLPAGPQEVR